jgi:hypothetical protein
MLKSGLFRACRWMTMVGAFVVAQACDSPSGLRELDGVSASARNQQVVVSNNSASAVFAMVIGRNAETRVDWYPCVDTVRCPPIQPGESRVHPYGNLMLDPGETEVVVHLWRAVTDASGVTHAEFFGPLILPLR